MELDRGRLRSWSVVADNYYLIRRPLQNGRIACFVSLIAGCLLLLLVFAPSSYAQMLDEVQQPNSTLQLGGEFLYLNHGGFSGVNVDNRPDFAAIANIHLSPSVPILSRIYLADALSGMDSGGWSAKGSPTYNNYLIELRIPLEMTILSHTTPLYIIYNYKNSSFTAEADKNTSIGERSFRQGENFNLGVEQNYIAIAVDTPTVAETGIDSYSRFGAFYTELYQIRSVDGEISESSLKMLDTTLRYAGLFYEIRTPALVDGLSFKTALSFGIGKHELNDNYLPISTSDIEGTGILAVIDFKLGLRYRYNISERFAIGAEGEYNLHYLADLGGGAGKDSEISNSSTNNFKAALFVNFVW